MENREWGMEKRECRMEEWISLVLLFRMLRPLMPLEQSRFLENGL